MEQLIIPRDIWLRGEKRNSRLLRGSDQKMCCIGIYLHQCRAIPKTELLDKIGPEAIAFEKFNIKTRNQFVNDWVYQNSNVSVLHLMQVNDYPCTNESIRERAITKLFLKHNVKVTFVDTLESK